MDVRKDVVERFLRYAKIDTQSVEGVEDRYPSTERQKDLANLLLKELQELGLEEIKLDQYGYLTASLPARIPAGVKAAEKIPTVGLLAHLDTYPAVSGKDVKPQIHLGYKGGAISLPALPDQPIRPEDNPDLLLYLGDDIITSDGSTLLGADDKAGVAEIMTLLALFKAVPKLPHPWIRVGFTPDEEVGNGTKFFDVKGFGAKVAYTLDGSGQGEVEDETFCADSALITLKGKDVHPGYAKGKMVNAVKLAAEFIARLPGQNAPETTDGRQSYLHAYQVTGNVSEAKITALVRAFSEEGLKEMEAELARIQQELLAAEPRAQIQIEIKESYRNMKYVLDQHPAVVTYAEEAVRRSGSTPKRTSIRGGTDGARLSFQGLPTPNLSAGGYNFHSRQEWVPVGAMVKAVEVMRALMAIYVEKGLA